MHTPEPWHLEQDTGSPVTNIGEPIAIVGGEETGESVRFVIGKYCDFGPHGDVQTAANAYRIVACVNACAGLNPAAVPALLAACKAAVEWCKHVYGSPDNDWPDFALDALTAVQLSKQWDVNK